MQFWAIWKAWWLSRIYCKKVVQLCFLGIFLSVRTTTGVLLRKMMNKSELDALERKYNKIFGIKSVYQLDPEIKTTIPDNKKKPVIFISAVENAEYHGGYKFNGGINEYNNLAKLLRIHGYEAFIVTYDGTYEEWLIEHQPHISLYKFREQLKVLPDVRCVTSWAVANVFISESRKIYFWDMELANTDNEHFAPLAKMYKHNKIVKTAAISRTIQAWHMAHFGKTPIIIPNLVDNKIWKPDNSKRVLNRVGYMVEGPNTVKEIEKIVLGVKEAGLDLEIIRIRGTTEEVLNGMQSCNIFLSMNMGKDTLWGEGCPRTILEALSTGAVVIGYDIIGNREILQDSFNGVIVPRYRTDIMIEKLVYLYKNLKIIDRMRSNGLLQINEIHQLESRWPAVKDFLNL
jgi:glycosyltransferase involved in cell wall biosynthesis